MNMVNLNNQHQLLSRNRLNKYLNLRVMQNKLMQRKTKIGKMMILKKRMRMKKKGRKTLSLKARKKKRSQHFKKILMKRKWNTDASIIAVDAKRSALLARSFIHVVFVTMMLNIKTQKTTKKHIKSTGIQYKRSNA